MAFTPQFLDEIRARVPLADVVGKRVKLQRAGREWKGLCPFHNEKSPSFSVVEDKGFYHCFGCGAHGDVIGFVMRTEGMNFPETVEKLAGEAGLAMPVTSPEERERFSARDGIMKAVEAACGFYEHQLRLSGGREALDYLKGRGLSDDTIARFRLGYAPRGNDALKSKLIKDGFDEATLLEAALISRPEDGRASYDFLRHRITFPIADQRGRIIAFGGRALGDGQPKYLNSRDSDVFHKGRALYGLALAREAARAKEEIVAVEGYMDVIALHQAGLTGAVAPLGTALTEGQIELLWRLTPEPVLCFDGDAAGRRAAARAAERALPLLRPGCSLRFAYMPPGEDPDSLVRAHGAQVMRDALDSARPLVDVVWEIATANRPADTPERRALVAKEARELVAHIVERSVQDAYRVEIDERLEKAFGRPGARRRDGRPFNRSGQSGGSRGGRGYDQRPTDTGLRSDGNVRVLDARHQQALLAAVINHPWLVGEFGEEIGTLHLASGDLDKLRQEIVNAWISDLDTGALKRHLSEHGFADLLDRVLSQDVLQHAAFARVGTEAESVRRGWSHIYDLFQRRQNFASEIEAARDAFAADPSQRNWAYLDALKRRVYAGDDDVEQFEEGGGRLTP
ncbi:MAG: DNA primase [Alphaproteobacteria bacterium]|nr:DNA primase [Alphaproteobacteria bacterium]